NRAIRLGRGAALSHTRIKICCLASLEEAQLAIDAGADAVGLIGRSAVPSSPRAIDDRTVAEITARVPSPLSTFVLTVATRASDVARHALAAGASTVQIVSHLSPEESAQLP